VGIISNCLVLYNNADSGGGIFLYNAAYPAIVNSTVYGNHSDSEGGGMYHVQDSFTKVINSIIWGNTAVTSAPQIYKYGGATPTATSRGAGAAQATRTPIPSSRTPPRVTFT